MAILNITSKAHAHIVALMKQDQTKKIFRLCVKKGGCTGYSYVPDLVTEAQSADAQFTTPEGLTVAVDEASIPMLEGTTIDLQEKALGQTQLIFNNPKAEDECGCGESFNLKET